MYKKYLPDSASLRQAGLPAFSASLGIVLGTLAFLTFTAKSVVTAANADHIVISEVQIAGVGATNDFIELYNPTGSSVDLNGFRLVKRTATGSADTSIKAWSSETVVPANSYYLWANSGWTPAVEADASTAATIAVNNGIALRQGPEDTGTIIDSFAWGTASNAFVEGTVFGSNPSASGSAERKACSSSTAGTMTGTDATNGNAEDTNNNANDFVLRTTSDPQNSEVTEAPGCTDATASPSASPTAMPTATPTEQPTATPTATPTVTPTAAPEETETPEPTVTPTSSPSATPTATPQSSPFLRFSLICSTKIKKIHFKFIDLEFPIITCKLKRV